MVEGQFVVSAECPHLAGLPETSVFQWSAGPELTSGVPAGLDCFGKRSRDQAGGSVMRRRIFTESPDPCSAYSNLTLGIGVSLTVPSLVFTSYRVAFHFDQISTC
jgi:hypothetical protein